MPSPGVSGRVFVGFVRVTQLLSEPHVNGCLGVEPSLEVKTISKGSRGTASLDGEDDVVTPYAEAIVKSKGL